MSRSRIVTKAAAISAAQEDHQVDPVKSLRIVFGAKQQMVVVLQRVDIIGTAHLRRRQIVAEREGPASKSAAG